MGKLNGQVAIVTGASNGIGRAIADVVAFVISEEARWLTGQNLHAGGGVVM